MRSLLQALEEGRLIELPEDKGKERALQILSNLIEAVPSIPRGTDVASAVMAREKVGSTVLGKGWACPHGRTETEGDLLCAVGWSPVGIDYAAPDGLPVRIVAMHLVPTNQKNAYLKEISSIARALQGQTDTAWEQGIGDLNQARERLLDMVSTAVESGTSEARARMIQLETRQAATAAAMPETLLGMAIYTLTVVAGPDGRPTVLTQQPELVGLLESFPDLVGTLTRQGMVEVEGWRVLSRGVMKYQADRVLFDCLAIRPSAATRRG
jgi:mannitol/fructose-specific phosphotransferase system IIA component (Ntr-type)